MHKAKVSGIGFQRDMLHLKPGPSNLSAEKFLGAIEETFVQRTVFFSAQGGEFFQLLALLPVETSRDFHEQAREKIAAIARVNVYNAFSAEFKDLSTLGPRWDFEICLPLESGNGDFAAERGERERDRNFTIEIIFFALEDRVLFDVDDNVEITGSAAANAGLPIRRGAQA
jgi:hypothetical protein